MFTATDPNGALIVGDFSRWSPGAWPGWRVREWKLDAYRAGLDIYKVLAASPEMFGVPYDDVTKPQRQTGKVGELSCGYGAGAGAVQSFAAGMGVEMTEAEAAKLVSDWRGTNPEVVVLWERLDDMLHRAAGRRDATRRWLCRTGLKLTLEPSDTPGLAGHPAPGGAVDPAGRCSTRTATPFLTRYFHGCYMRGRNVGYYKPSERKTGDLWKNHFTDPKTKQVTVLRALRREARGHPDAVVLPGDLLPVAGPGARLVPGHRGHRRWSDSSTTRSSWTGRPAGG